MASSPEFHGTTTPNSGGASGSHFQKTVRLLDWWLIRAENDSNGKTLAVAGLTSTPGQPVRVFSSAPIVKRYDVFTLETADGICVVLKGFINKLRTTDNGFTPKVFKHFVFGFPSNWETHAANCFQGGASDSTAGGGNVSDTENLPCTSKSVTDADMNNCTLTNMNSPLREISPSNGLDHGDSMAEETMQTTSATETPVPFTGADVQDEEVENKGKKERESRKKAKKKIIFDSPGSGVSMNTRGRREKNCLISPECRSYGRSRSGRVLLPTMEFWRNQLPVYDLDRKLRGIREEQQKKKPESQPRNFRNQEQTKVGLLCAGRKSIGGRKRK